jgi:hypothetical protein
MSPKGMSHVPQHTSTSKPKTKTRYPFFNQGKGESMMEYTEAMETCEAMGEETAAQAQSPPIPDAQTITHGVYDIPTFSVVMPGDESLSSLSIPLQQNSDMEEDRLEKGSCPNCGEQLFEIKKSKGFVSKILSKNKVNRAKPLTIDGQVNRGQCLRCVGASASVVAHPERARSDHEEVLPDYDQQEVGAGTMTVAADVIIPQSTGKYVGPFNDYGQFHGGPAEFTWSNGDRYVGTFWNGQRHGTQCSLFFADGSEYIGSFEHNEFHGEGTRRFRDGSVYSGHYVRGKRCGEGRYYYANGDLSVGLWADDCILHGKYYYAKGQVYDGFFHNGLRHGRGKYTWTDGQTEVYMYEEDKRVSEYGVRWNAKRTKAWKLEGKKKVSRISLDDASDLAKALGR